MLLSSFLIRGFEQKIESKIFDFWANIHILPFSFTNNFLEAPLQADSSIIQILKDNSEVEKIAFSANKGVILKKSDNIEGLILKGSYNMGANRVSFGSNEMLISLDVGQGRAPNKKSRIIRQNMKENG